MKTSPVTCLPAPLNLVAASPCMLALMSGFDHFYVDFFLMGNVAGHCQLKAEEIQPESSIFTEGYQISPLQPTDWAIFISDWVPYIDLKAWLIENAGFTSSEQNNEFYLRYDLAEGTAPVTVALIPFSELGMLDEHWIPTGFGMATNLNKIKIESVLDKAPVCATPNGPVWQPTVLIEIMGQKLLSLDPDVPIVSSREDAQDVSSLVQNYEFLEQEMVFLFHHDMLWDENTASSYTELQKRKSYARILGRHMAFTMHGNEIL